MADTLKDIPEFFETELGESIAARTDALGNMIYSTGRVCVLTYIYIFLGTFRELGPPDLCHIIKAHSKPGMKEVNISPSICML